MRCVPSLYKVETVRDFPHDRPMESSNFHRDNDTYDLIRAFVYLVDIDETRGFLFYVPGSNRFDVTSSKPRRSQDLDIDDNDRRISDREIERYYPEDTWAVVKAKRGSVAIFHSNGFHKGPSWPKYGDSKNKPRTALKFNFMYKAGRGVRDKGNKIKREDYARLSRLQKLFTSQYQIVDE